jgi:outer membrane protein with beta-barrel domain
MRKLHFAIVLLMASHAGAEELGQKRNGFAAEMHIGTQLFSLGTGMGTTSFGVVQGGVFLGGKIDRVVVGLGFDLGRVASGTSVTGGGDSSQASTAIMFTPGVRVAIVRSHDQRVELFGEFDMGFGTLVNEQSPAPMAGGPSTSRFRFAYDVGPGVRFWVHPQFAISGFTGVQGQFEYDSTTQAGVTQKTSSGLTSIFAALQLLGVF